MTNLPEEGFYRCQAVLAGEVCNTPIRWNERLNEWIHCPDGQIQGSGWQHQAVPPQQEKP